MRNLIICALLVCIVGCEKVESAAVWLRTPYIPPEKYVEMMTCLPEQDVVDARIRNPLDSNVVVFACKKQMCQASPQRTGEGNWQYGIRISREMQVCELRAQTFKDCPRLILQAGEEQPFPNVDLSHSFTAIDIETGSVLGYPRNACADKEARLPTTQELEEAVYKGKIGFSGCVPHLELDDLIRVADGKSVKSGDITVINGGDKKVRVFRDDTLGKRSKEMSLLPGLSASFTQMNASEKFKIFSSDNALITEWLPTCTKQRVKDPKEGL